MTKWHNRCVETKNKKQAFWLTEKLATREQRGQTGSHIMQGWVKHSKPNMSYSLKELLFTSGPCEIDP